MLSVRYYTRAHWLCRPALDPRLPPEARPFWDHLSHATGCVVAYDAGRVVGFLRWDGDYSQGTWVAEGYRRQGLAMALWSRMIERRKPKWFHVTTVTPAGRRFVTELVSAFPEVNWDLEAA